MSTKKCPFCAEEIQEEAIKCRHCQTDFAEQAKKAKFQQVAKTNAKTAIGCSVVIMIVVCVIFFTILASCNSETSIPAQPPSQPTVTQEEAPSPTVEQGGELIGKTCKISLIEQDTMYSYHPPSPEIRYAYKSYDIWSDTNPPGFPKAFRNGTMTTLKAGTRVKALDYIMPLYKVQIMGKKATWWVNQNDLEISER